MRAWFNYLSKYGRPQGYENWADAIFRDLYGLDVLDCIAFWWLYKGPKKWWNWSVPYVFQRGYGLRYELWYQLMRIRNHIKRGKRGGLLRFVTWEEMLEWQNIGALSRYVKMMMVFMI